MLVTTGEAKSVVLTDEGLTLARRLFETYFRKSE